MAAAMNVREITEKDIEYLVKYWTESDPASMLLMGVDLNKIPEPEALENMLMEQIKTEITKKQSYCIIWELDGRPAGHSNVNKISFGKEAYMHLHLWNSNERMKGMGSGFVKKTLPHFFENLKLQNLYCEPFAFNEAPNRTLKKLGFQFEKRYVTIPGSLNFEQEVNRWALNKDQYLKICKA
jgi:RimJ/RimL family protein N-acetyltransferase